MVTSLIAPLAKDLAPEPQPNQAKANCLAKGGTWDEATQTCKLPAPKQEEVKRPEPTQEQPQRGTPTGDGVITSATGEKRVQTEEDLVRARQNILRIQGGRQTVEEEEAAQAQAQTVEAERQRLIQEETPQRRELDPLEVQGGKIPVLGATAVLAKAIGIPLKKSLGLPVFQDDIELTPEELRTEALTQIERQEIDRGLTANEQFGALVESIPVFGSLANKFAGGLIETPSENAQQVKTNVLKEKRRISNIETNVKLGYLPVSVAQEQITDIENNIQRLESRMRLLINNSPELQFNSDLVNTYETEILLTREKAFQAKQNILTGASQDPDELQLLQKIQELQGEEEQ